MVGLNQKFMKRRWLEFRWGYSYLAYILSGINFITITYYLLLDRIPVAKALFPRMWIYAVFAATVIPLVAVLIGHFWHKKRQLETDVLVTQEPMLREIRRIVREELREVVMQK